jgi:3'5'-cyclic nucleotide phosphodiesterase
VSWDLLMQPKYEQLRRAIYNSDAERERFLQLVINCVMATDIVNPQLKELRNGRWDKAFKSKSKDEDDVNRKATIVIEHLIQASDVSHTMQHWHIYRKWNERLFNEMYSAFREGRSDKNPADFWAKGEVGFFDFYIIPLAKKLKECGVFGVSSDEYLQYAVKNRNEWEAKGEAVVKEMLEKIELDYDE